MSNIFVTRSVTPEDYWRCIVLFGRNSECYKFALAAALLELKPQSGEIVSLEDLAPVYGRHIARHISASPKQGTSATNKFLSACREFNQHNDINKLVDATLEGGFNYVLDRFHVLPNGLVKHPFFVKQARNGIKIRDELSIILESSQRNNLPYEVEARWKLVETAWELGVGTNLLTIHHDHAECRLVAYSGNKRRKSVTGSRAALNGYQRGNCFYCGSSISIDASFVSADVDHFFPHILKDRANLKEVDLIWNLVLSCRGCNRGQDGKFTKVPDDRLVKRLFLRNEYYIESLHPLRETLLQQTGAKQEDRHRFFQSILNRAVITLPGDRWYPQ